MSRNSRASLQNSTEHSYLPQHFKSKPVTVKQKRGAWIWPRGGREPGSFAKLKDILCNRGPDIYVAYNHFGKAAGPREGPTRGQWSGWGEANGPCMTCHSDSRRHDITDLTGRARDPRKRYDYCSRKYKIPAPGDLVVADHYLDKRGKRRVSSAQVYQGADVPDKLIHFRSLARTRNINSKNFQSRDLIGSDLGERSRQNTQRATDGHENSKLRPNKPASWP